MERRRRWGGHYDGGIGAEDFLDQLDDLRDSYEVTPDQMLRCLPGILKGSALQWFRNEKADIPTWDAFFNAFRQTYLPRRRQHELEMAIHQRRQRPGEKAREFVTALRTLMRRHGQRPAASQLDWLYSNPRAEYRHYIKRADFDSLAGLLGLAPEYEALREEEPSRAPVQPDVPKPNLAEVGTRYNRGRVLLELRPARPFSPGLPLARAAILQPREDERTVQSGMRMPLASGNDNGSGGREHDRTTHPNGLNKPRNR